MRLTTTRILLTGAFALSLLAIDARAATLVTNPFITSYENWVDPFPARAGFWRINVGNGTLMETSNAIPAGGDPSGTTNTGNFVPTMMIQNAFTTPSTYDLTGRLYTGDDDGLGLVFGMQPNGDYFRVSMRQQTGGSFGHTQGLSVQKVIGGVVTQLNPAGAVAGPAAITVPMIDGHTAIDVKVAVNGNNYEVFFNGTSLASGSDAALAAGKIGVYSWAQITRNLGNRPWGTELETIAVSDNTGTLYSGNFTNLPVSWRRHVMTNTAGLRTDATQVFNAGTGNVGSGGDDLGDFGLDYRGWISDRTNGFEWATQTTANTDFIGPAVVVNDLGAASMTDYEMRIRMGSTDNDGLGVLVRVQDDDNFYRIHFATQSIAATNAWERAPAGLSVQKVLGGVWSELFRDTQGAELFVPDDSAAQGITPATGLPMFDLSVKVVGNTITVQVIDALNNVINYPVIVDASSPLLSGSVGLTVWGNDSTYYQPYGGQPGSLVIEIPEPATICLALVAGLGLLVARRTWHGPANS